MDWFSGEKYWLNEKTRMKEINTHWMSWAYNQNLKETYYPNITKLIYDIWIGLRENLWETLISNYVTQNMAVLQMFLEHLENNAAVAIVSLSPSAMGSYLDGWL